MKQFSDIGAVLEQRKEDQLFRTRAQLQSAQGVRVIIDGQSMLSFCSNDYLGLANHPRVSAAMIASVQTQGVGAGASHLIDGHHLEHEQLERELASFVGREKALLFSTGYMANLGVISALMTRHDTIIQDKLNHASLIDGGLLSQARSMRYRHNDLEHLQQCLASATGKKLVVTDGVFSMDGDCAPLTEIAQLCTQYGAWLLVDDAHGIGTLGNTGAGLIEHLGLSSQEVPLMIGTLGKAFGTSGAFVAGDAQTIEYILQFSRPYTYTTASPPAIAAATRQSLQLVINGAERRAQLKKNIDYFRAQVGALGFALMESHTAIQPVVVGTNERALELSASLQTHGILVSAIRPPTVPKGTARLRFTLSADHQLADIDTLCDVLKVFS